LKFDLDDIDGPEWQYIHLTNFSINKQNEKSDINLKALFSELLQDLKD